MADIILINPRGEADNPFQGGALGRIPLGLLAIASYLKSQGYNPIILDAGVYDDSYLFARLSELLQSSELNNVGFSVMTAQVPHALRISEFIREKNPRLPIVWGGVHGTLFPAQTSAHPLVDYVVTGRGEVPFSELVKHLERGESHFDNIDGLAFGGKVIPRTKIKDIDINQLPSLDYELLDLPHYVGSAPHFLLSPRKPIRVLEVLSSRGCPWSCTFCINNVTKNYWRALTPDRFLDELQHLVEKFQLDAVRIIDEDFFVSKKRAFAIVEGLLKRDLKIIWAANARANYFRGDYINESFAHTLYQAGMRVISMGAESGSNRVLQFLRKGITTDELLNSARVCQQAGIKPVYAWMVGLPTETKEEMLQSISLASKIHQVCPSTQHSGSVMFIFRPYPGGELYELCRKYGLSEPQSLDEWAEIMMTADDPKLGYYGVDRLPWITHKRFVEFISSQFLALVAPLNIMAKSGLPSWVHAVLMRLAFRFWGFAPLRKLFLGIHHGMRSLYRI